MTKASRTRQFIIDKTAPVFNRRGYAGTSLLDITKATRLSKGALYGNFSNKEEIAVAVFHHSMEKVREAVDREMEMATTYKEKISRFLTFYEKYVFDTPVPGGCPLMNAAVDADDHNLFLKKAVARKAGDTINFLTTLFEKGRKAGEFNPEIHPAELARFFFCAVEGAIVISRVSSSPAPMNTVVAQCRKILQQISK